MAALTFLAAALRRTGALIQRMGMSIGQMAASPSPAARPEYCGKHIQVMPGTFVSPDSEIGDYTFVGSNCVISKSRIGRYCSIASNAFIGPGEHDIYRVSTSSHFCDDPYGLLTRDECVIGNDVWVGVDSIVRRGVHLGDGVVIGANSFVNSDIPDFAVAAGSPARILKMRFSPRIIDLIKASLWWEHDLDEARSIVARLETVLAEKQTEV